MHLVLLQGVVTLPTLFGSKISMQRGALAWVPEVPWH